MMEACELEPMGFDFFSAIVEMHEMDDGVRSDSVLLWYSMHCMVRSRPPCYCVVLV